jgi:hypothetical protein
MQFKPRISEFLVLFGISYNEVLAPIYSYSFPANFLTSTTNHIAGAAWAIGAIEIVGMPGLESRLYASYFTYSLACPNTLHHLHPTFYASELGETALAARQGDCP